MANGSEIQRKILGERLRKLRGRSRFTLAEAAKRLEMSTSALSRIETGQQVPSVHLMKSILDEYGVTADRWDEYLQQTREARQRGWWEAFPDGRRNSYVGLEADATVVWEYCIAFPPGLLQTADTARALFASAGRMTETDLESNVKLRMLRQERLTSTADPLELVVVIDESVLYRSIGGPEVLAGQHARLVESAQLPSVTLQVLPFSGVRGAAQASGLIILGFGEIGHPDLVYVEHALSSLTMEKEAEVHRARLAFDQLRSDALNPAESLALIRRIAEQHQLGRDAREPR